MVLMSLLCSTLASNVNIKDAHDPTSVSLFEICSELAPLEPEFILKVLCCEGEDGSGKRGGGNCGHGV